MSVAQLPPLDFDSRGLRISLFQRTDTPPLVTQDPISGEPTVAEQDHSTTPEPQIPERRRPQLDSKTQDTSVASHRSSLSRGQDSVQSLNGAEQQETEERTRQQRTPQSAATQSTAGGDDASLLSETGQTDLDIDEETQQSPTKRIPTHPIASLQDAFAESLDEVTTGSGTVKPKLRSLNGKARRERLLDQGKDEEPFDSLWRYRPSQDQHEIMKLLAQISFGVYLLMNGMANSNSQVVNILQGHIDEVDEFLEVALEDLQQATIDLNGRIDYLKLPMSNLKAFEELLEDRNFRTEILQGNEKIEHILARTNIALRQWDDDIEAGLLCSSAFTTWLKEQDGGAWTKQRPDVVDIYEAMNGNAEGWQNAFDEMNKRAQELNNLIIKLMTIVAEMEKKAGEISRRTWAQIPPFSGPALGSDKSFNSSRPTEALSRNESMRSGSTMQPSKAAMDADNDSISDYPLPGAAPLLPPPRMSIRGAQGRPSSSSASSARKQPSLAPIATSPPISEKVELNAEDSGSNVDEEPLYILQPRTYTPQPRESVPSPVVRQTSVHSSQPSHSSRGHDSISGNSSIQKQGSLRQRVSLKTKPPVSIQIPPRNLTEARQQRASPSSATPRTGVSFAHDPSHDSDGEPNPQYRQISRVASYSELSPPVRPPLMPSPHSDHNGQFYRPVLASPHSPLQQRPHTSGTGAAASHTYQPSPGFQRQHVRNQPSRLGGMSMLSNVTNAGYEHHDDARTIATQRTVQGSKRTLKKKKSAFGWLKKAFTMDDDERAAYEARKAMQVNPHYYSAESPKFLDGRRIR